MEINENAPVIAKGMIEINSNPEIIWDMIADVERWPIWNRDVQNASLEGKVAKGSKFKWKSSSLTITSIFQEDNRPKILGWTGETMGIKAIHIWRFEPEDNKTIVRTEESWERPLTHLTRNRTQDMLQKSIDSVLNYLKIEVERVSN